MVKVTEEIYCKKKKKIASTTSNLKFIWLKKNRPRKGLGKKPYICCNFQLHTRGPVLLLLDKNHQNVSNDSKHRCFSEGNVPSPRGLHPKTTTLRHHFCGIPLTAALLSQPFSNMKALSKTLAQWWVGGGSAWGDSVGELAQAHCHCWQEEEGGELGGDTECESWCDWFQIE